MYAVKVGVGLSVIPWTTKLGNAYRIVLGMEISIWKPKNVFVKDNGPEMIVQKVNIIILKGKPEAEVNTNVFNLLGIIFY